MIFQCCSSIQGCSSTEGCNYAPCVRFVHLQFLVQASAAEELGVPTSSLRLILAGKMIDEHTVLAAVPAFHPGCTLCLFVSGGAHQQLGRVASSRAVQVRSSTAAHSESSHQATLSHSGYQLFLGSYSFKSNVLRGDPEQRSASGSSAGHR